jgi:N-acetylneuraminic acid mutarotase
MIASGRGMTIMHASNGPRSFLAWLVVASAVLLACGAGEGAAARAAPAAARASAGPPPLAYDVLAYAPDAERVLMVSGHVGFCWSSGVPGNHGVWSFDAGPRRWAQLTAEAPGHADAAAYDARAERLVAWFSYATPETCEPTFPASIAETWAFDWRTGEWEDRQPSASPPAGLLQGGAQIVYDERAGKVILFGGLDLDKLGALFEDGVPVTNEELFSNRTWAYDYDANAWTDLEASNAPPGRNSHMLVYDSGTQRVFLFGGGDLDQDFHDTWAYDSESNAWTELAPPTHPDGRAYAAMAYDAAARKVATFGGVDYFESPFPAETWLYDPAVNDWSRADPAASPSPRGWGAMAYSAKANAVVMYGGGPTRDDATDETWLFRTAPAAWRQVERR